MKEKRIQLLQVLDEEKYKTGEELAILLGVSSKTVRQMIRELNELLDGHGAQVESRHRVGYRLAVTDAAAFRRWEKEEPLISDVPENSQERIRYILRLLLENREYIKLDDLSENLFISKTTLSKEMRTVEKILEPYHLKLVHRPNYGTAVEGEEFHIRQYLADHGISQKRPGEQDRRLLERYLDECLDRYQIQMSEVAVRNLIQHLEIAMERIQKKYYIEEEGYLDWIPETNREYQAAADMAAAMEELFQVHFPKSEIAYVAIHMAGKRAFHLDQTNTVISPEITSLVNHMIQMVHTGFSFDFSSDLELRMSLSQHLIPLEFRLRHKLTMKNPLTREIKEKYALAYAMAAQASIAIEQHYEASLAEDEIAYIALLFALGLFRKNNEFDQKNIILVCASGHGSAELLRYKYRQEFGRYLNRLETCDLRGLKEMDFSGFDYIFTTVPIDFPVPIPIQEVCYFLEPKEIRKVRTVLESSGKNRIQKYFEEELFIPNLWAEDREQVLRVMCRHLIRRKQLPPAFFDSVMKREELAQTDFGNQVALPHAFEAMSDQTYVCVAILDRPILWSDKEVQVVFLLSIEKQKNQGLQHFFQVISEYLLDKLSIHKLIRDRDYTSFIQAICEKENEILQEDEDNG